MSVIHPLEQEFSGADRRWILIVHSDGLSPPDLLFAELFTRKILGRFLSASAFFLL